MTDLLDRSIDGPSLDEEPAVQTRTDPCHCQLTHDSIDGLCPNDLPVGHSPKRKYCDDCPKGAHRRARSDAPPVGVTINLGKGATSKLNSTEQAVVESASAWLGMATLLLETTGDVTCAAAIKEATPQIALQLAKLSKFHPVIVKILAPVEATGEVLVWVSLVIAISPVILTVLAHHNLISKEMGERLGMVTAMGAVVAQAKPEA